MTLLLIVIVILMLGGGGMWYGYNTNAMPANVTPVMSILLIVLLVFLLFGGVYGLHSSFWSHY